MNLINFIKKNIVLFQLLLLITLGLSIYSNAFNAQFVFDDIEFIVNNLYIKRFDHVDGFWSEAFPKTRTIPLYSFALNYWLNGQDPFGYHLFNVIIHLITSIMVWIFARLLLSSSKSPDNYIIKNKNSIAFFSALLFLTHPVHTQAITYITQRFASICTLFYITSLCFYIKGRKIQGNKFSKYVYWFLALIFSISSIASKEIGITIPFAIALVEFIFFKKSNTPLISNQNNKRILTKLITNTILTALIILFFMKIFSMLFGGFNILGLSNYHRISESHDGDIITLGNYLLSQPRVFSTYLKLFFFPMNLNLEHDFLVSKSFFDPSTLLCFIFVALILWLGIYLTKKQKIISFGILWFFTTYIANLHPRVNLIFEHKLYLLSIGPCIAITAVLFKFNKKRIYSIISICSILAIFSYLTYQRNKVWQNETTLWLDVIQKSPNKARAHQNMGYLNINNGQYDKAIQHLTEAIRINPKDVKSLSNRGAAYYHKKMYAKAFKDLNKAIEIDPDYYGSYCNRGIVYEEIGNLKAALDDYQTGLKIKPLFRHALIKRGNLLQKLKRPDLSIADFEQAIKINPHYPDPYNGLARAYYEMKDYDNALKAFNKAIKVDPNFSASYANRGYFHLLMNNIDLAYKDINVAIRLNPQNFNALHNRGLLHKIKGQKNKAIQDFTTSIQYEPTYVKSYIERSNIYSAQKNYAFALKDLKLITKFLPKFSDAYQKIGIIYLIKKQYSLALENFNKAISINPNYAEAYSYRSKVFEIIGEIEKSQRDAKRAEELNGVNSK